MSKANKAAVWWVIVIATVAALALRGWFIATTRVDNPLRGDAYEYVAYANNIVHHQVFSSTSDATQLKPDNYRDPGYPIFLSAWFAAMDDPARRYSTIAWAQALLGALTVAAYLLLARRWMGPRWLAFCAALLVAWPHSISMPAYLLSETLVGFLLATGLLLLEEGLAREQPKWLAWGAASFGLAGLTNAALAPFLPLMAAAAYVALPRQRRAFALVFLISLAPPACWAVRTVVAVEGPATSSRAIINLVQGSWPEYHDAWQTSVYGDPVGKAISERIDGDVREAVRDPWAGVIAILTRIRSEPQRYIVWYAAKPARLWAWDMRIAAAPLYAFPTRDSPLESNEVMRIIVLGLKALNPWIALLALTGCVMAFTGITSRRTSITALVLLHASIVYGVFQSEPRYAVPFRGAELVMATLAISWLVHRMLMSPFWGPPSHSEPSHASKPVDGMDRATGALHSAKNPPCFRPGTTTVSP